MIGQGFNFVYSTFKEMTGFFEIRVENLEPKEEKRKSSMFSKKSKDKKSIKKRKRVDSNSSVVESILFILRGICSDSTDNCEDLHAIINKHKEKKKKNFKCDGKDNRKLNDLIEKKKKFVNNKKRRKTQIDLQQF